jgi:hypothetical protein
VRHHPRVTDFEKPGPEPGAEPVAEAGAEPAAEPGAEPVVARVAGAIEGGVRAAVEATARKWQERPGARVRRVRRLARRPLPYLYDVHPEALQANPRELGVNAVAVADIAGTAVGPPGQRGGDFLPLRPFRSPNWSERWHRIRAAVDRLVVLPPIEVGRYGGRYWVFDGHNRVAAALYVGQVEIDADLKDLVPPGGGQRAPASSLETVLEDRVQLQAAVSRRTLSDDPSDPPAGTESGSPANGGPAERPADRS